MNGAGNKILVLDLRGSPSRRAPEDARAIHRAPGLDYDQMMVMGDPRTAGTAAYVLIYNNDGTLAGRLRQRHALRRGSAVPRARRRQRRRSRPRPASSPASVWASGPTGSTWARLGSTGRPFRSRAPVPDTRRVDLWPDGEGPAGLGPARSSTWAIRMRCSSSPTSPASMRRILARRIEVHPMFPEKANVTFAHVIARDDVIARVWERGVGLTLACGSAACATLVAASRLGSMERAGTVRLPGGELVIEWRAADDHVLMTGPVEFEGEFILDDALVEAAAP